MHLADRTHKTLRLAVLMVWLDDRLPTGWRWVTLNALQADEPRAITDGPFGSHLTSAHYTVEGPRVVRLQNIGDGHFIDTPAHISALHFESLRAHEVLSGDLLIASLGEDLPRACLAPPLLGPAIVKADCIRIRLRPSVDARWVLYALQSPRVRRWASAKMHGVGRRRLGLKSIRSLPVPLPTLAEQRRIVEVLEVHLSHLDAAEQWLASVDRRLAALERAVLADVHHDEFEIVPLPTVADIQGGIQKQPRRAPGRNAFPFLRVANVTKSGLDLTEVHSIELFGDELERLHLEPGDLLVVEGNGSASQIGRAAVWDGSIVDCVHQNHLIRVRPLASLLARYLEVLWNAPQSRHRLTEIASSTSGLYTLSVSKLKSLSIPLPSMPQQVEIVQRVTRVREERRRLEGVVAKAQERSHMLKHSLMEAAFSGRLVVSSGAVAIEELADV